MNSRKSRAGVRASKRRKVAEPQDETDGQGNEADGEASAPSSSRDYEWECVAVTLDDYNTFIDSLKRSKDLNEQALRDRLMEDVLPVIEKIEESQQKKALRREKELIALEKLATAKRSSRIASKQDRIRQEAQAAEEAKRQEAERIAEQKSKEKAEKVEKERQYRLMTREQRLKDREEKRKQQEEELVRLTEKAKLAEDGEARISRRTFNAELEKRQKGLEKLETEDWTFDCSGCGVHGENLVCAPLTPLLLYREYTNIYTLRMTDLIALHVTSAMSGSIASALVSPRRMRRRMISTSYVQTANDASKKQKDPRFHR